MIVQFLRLLVHYLTRFTWSVRFSLAPADVRVGHIVEAGDVGACFLVSGVFLLACWLPLRLLKNSQMIKY